MGKSANLRASTIGAHQLLSVIDRQNANLCLGLFWWERQGDLPDFSSDSASTTDAGSFESNAVMHKLVLNDEVYLTNGWDVPQIWDGITLRQAGEAAAPAPTIAIGSGTGLTGSYSAIYTYYDSAHDYETAPVAIAPTVIALANTSLAVTVTASAIARFDKIRIYRNATGVPATFLMDTEVNNASATIQLSMADASLGADVSYAGQPPLAKFVAKCSTRIFWGGSRPWNTGTANVTLDSATVTLSETPPQAMYTRDANAPMYFRRKGGPRYAVTAISGNTLTLNNVYKGATENGVNFSICGLRTRIWFADRSAAGLIKAEGWISTDYFDFGVEGDSAETEYQDEITAILDYGNRLYGFMRESIWQWDPLIRQVKKSGARRGTLSANTICKDRDGNLLYVGTDQQFYAFNGYTSVLVTGKIRNRFAANNRHNLNLAEYSFAYYDDREGLYVANRPNQNATISAMRYVVDIYDDYRGEIVERVAPRITAVATLRDETKQMILGIDTLGIVHRMDDYDTSATFGSDKFTAVTPTVKTSTAGEISPGSNAQGLVAVVYNSTTIKGSKLIAGTATTSAITEDLTDAVTVAAADSYLIGAWHGVFETGWLDCGQPGNFKSFFFLEGTFIKGSSGFLYVWWYTEENATAVQNPMVITAHTERQFKKSIPCRGLQIKFRFESASELVGFGLRELRLSYKLLGGS